MPRLRVDPSSFDVAALRPAADWLRQGRVVAFPTDTWYGLAADPTSPAAIEEIFRLKRRPSSMPLPLVGGSRLQIEATCGPLGAAGERLATLFWPGPLSLLCDAPPGVVAVVHAGTGAVAVRVPDHPIARALALVFGGLLTATSANLSGQPPVATPDGLTPLDSGDDALLILDGGATPGGAASTIVDARRTPPHLVRAGAIAWDRVLESLQA